MAVTTSMTLSGLECAAINRLAKDLKEQAKNMDTGRSQKVDLMLHVTGLLNKGEGHEMRSTQKPKAEDLAAWFLSRLSPQARSKIMDDFAEMSKGGKGVPHVEDDHIRGLAATLVERATKSRKIPVTGSVTGALRLEAVDVGKLKAPVVQALAKSVRAIDLDFDAEDSDEE